MSKRKLKDRRKETPAEPKPRHDESALLKPQRPNKLLLAVSGSLLALWLTYLFVVAMWGW